MRVLGLLLICILYSCQNSNNNHESPDQSLIENTSHNENLIAQIEDDTTLVILEELILQNKDTCKTKFYQAIKIAWKEDLTEAKKQFDNFEECAILNNFNGYYRIAHNHLYDFVFTKEITPLKKSIQVLVPKLDSLDYYPVSIFSKDKDGLHSLIVKGLPPKWN
jgi:hypothetical protein